MSFRKLSTEVRREQIAQAAVDIIAESGLRKLSIASVARRIGLVPSALYRHFKSKDQILEAALDLMREQGGAMFDEACAGASTTLERLSAFLQQRVGHDHIGIAMERIIFSDEVFSGRLRVRAKLKEVTDYYLNRIAGLIEQGQADGTIRSDALAETMALVFVGLFQPLNVLRRLSDGEVDTVRQAERAWKIFRDAVAAPETE